MHPVKARLQITVKGSKPFITTFFWTLSLDLRFHDFLAADVLFVMQPTLRYKDAVKNNLRRCGIGLDRSESTAQARATWRRTRRERSLTSLGRGALVYPLRNVSRVRPLVPPQTLSINAAPATGFEAQESGSTPTKERVANSSRILTHWFTTRECIIIFIIIIISSLSSHLMMK